MLQFSEHSAYSLQKSMQESTGFFYGASQGNINPTLKRLNTAKLIDSRDVATGKRKSVIYKITEAGQGAFDTWLKDGISVGRVRDDTLVKLFFMGQMNPTIRRKNIDNFCEELKSTREALTFIKRATKDKLAGRQPTSIERYRLETLEYGIDFYAFNLKWYKRLAERDGTAK